HERFAHSTRRLRPRSANPPAPSAPGRPGGDLRLLVGEHAVIGSIGGVEIPEQSVDVFVEREPTVAIAIGAAKGLGVELGQLADDQVAVLVTIAEEERLDDHAVELLAVEPAVAVPVTVLEDLAEIGWRRRLGGCGEGGDHDESQGGHSRAPPRTRTGPGSADQSQLTFQLPSG